MNGLKKVVCIEHFHHQISDESHLSISKFEIGGILTWTVSYSSPALPAVPKIRTMYVMQFGQNNDRNLIYFEPYKFLKTKFILVLEILYYSKGKLVF